MSRRRAFTLVEMLLVVAVIALLISILLPSLKNAKNHANVARCLANHRGLLIGWHTYSAENSGTLMGAHTGRPGYDWIQNVSSPLNPSNETVDHIRNGRMWKYAASLEMYKCPEEPRPLYLRSYSISNLVGGTSDWGVRSRLRVRSLKLTSKTLVFIEEPDPRGYNWGSWVINPKNHPSNSQWIDWAASFHFGSACTVSMADGRAEMWRWEDPRTPKIQDFYSVTPDNVDLKRLQEYYNPGDPE
jgi:prepilin-type N-terminal cleavage/methylation domain-containing protein